jgi:hypothetical protein
MGASSSASDFAGCTPRPRSKPAQRVTFCGPPLLSQDIAVARKQSAGFNCGPRRRS